MKTQTRTREYVEGWKGRRRNYKCRRCGEKFQVDTLNPLKDKLRICPDCIAKLRAEADEPQMDEQRLIKKEGDK